MFCYKVNIYHHKEEIISKVIELKTQGETIGFVPTMGALHEGHLSLMEQALEQHTVVVVSIFVNPTQFNNKQDLVKYPRTLQRDMGLLESLEGEVVLYAPTVEDIYGKNIESQKFDFDGLENIMEGEFRPGHFDGVGTVVRRLFDIVKPDAAYFGMKDYQQFRIVQKLVEKYQIPVRVVGCEIYREDDGLAMSSRNERLKPEFRAAAPFIYKTLKSAKTKFGTESAIKVAEWVEDQFAQHDLLKLEYFTIAEENTLTPAIEKSEDKSYRAFIAVYADDIRLIDNIALK